MKRWFWERLENLLDALSWMLAVLFVVWLALKVLP